MEKVIKYIKKNYILFTIIGAILLVVIASLIITLLIKNSKNKIVVKSENIEIYEYVDMQKKSSLAKVSLENNKIVEIKPEDFNIYQNGLIYVNEENRVIVPKNSMIVFYYQDNLTYKLSKYSELIQNNNSKIIISEGKKIISDNFFIYDGEDTYIIPDLSNLIINGEELILGANSFVIASPDSIIYYDYDNDIINKVNDIKSASIKVNNIVIDLLKDVTVYNNKVVLLDNDVNKMAVYKED